MSVLQIHSQSHTHSPATLLGTPWCTTLTRTVWTLEVCSGGSQRLFEACPLWPLTPAINKAISSTCPPLAGFFFLSILGTFCGNPGESGNVGRIQGTSSRHKQDQQPVCRQIRLHVNLVQRPLNPIFFPVMMLALTFSKSFSPPLQLVASDFVTFANKQQELAKKSGQWLKQLKVTHTCI